MKEIANILNLKPGTVAFHKYRIMQTSGSEKQCGTASVRHPASLGCLRP